MTTRNLTSSVYVNPSTMRDKRGQLYHQTCCWACQRPLVRKINPPHLHYCSMECWRKYAASTQYARLWSQITQEGDCWIWHGSVDKLGYGHISIQKQPWLLHRYIYVLTRGPLPDELVIDHLCRRPPCVNPAHLDPVPQRVNVFRGLSPIAANVHKTHCAQGHAYSLENTWISPAGGRGCRQCNRERARRRLQREREIAPKKTTAEQDVQLAIILTHKIEAGFSRREVARTLRMSPSAVDRLLRYHRFIRATSCYITQRRFRRYWEEHTDPSMRARNPVTLAACEDTIFQRIAERIRTWETRA